MKNKEYLKYYRIFPFSGDWMYVKTIFGLLFVMILFFSGCVSNQSVEETQLEIPGTGACQTILRQLADAFNESNPGYEVLIPESIGSSGGIRSTGEDESIIGRVARQIKDDEKDYGLSYLPFAIDVVVFAVSDDVGVINLTTEQIVNIFSGNITNWNEVGGSNITINVFIREEGDSSLSVIQGKIPSFNDIVFSENASTMYFDYEMVDALDKFPSSIGFLTSSSLINMDSIQPISLNGIIPNKTNIENGKYNLTSEYGFVYKEQNLNKIATMFLNFVFSDDGAQIIEDYGLITVERK
jgi:phosphate transport system substrate-binding protein